MSREDLKADLVVVGGGMSGTCAAIAAARAGADVVIVQERPVFGGSGSSEIRVPVSGAASSNAWSAEGGLIHEILLRDRATDPNGPRSAGPHLDRILDDYLESTPGLRAIRSTVVHTVETADDGRVSAVIGTQLGSERTLRVTGRQFIEATGDATLAVLAGARTRYGREARDEYGESFAPVSADESSLGSTISLQARRMERPVPFHAPAWAIDYSHAGLTFDRTMPKVDGDVLTGFWWIEVNDPYHQVHDNQAIRRQLHRHVLGLWDFLKNESDRRDELADFDLEWIGQIPGKRESRRVVGDVTVTQHDVTAPTHWADEIGTAGWWIDLHVKGGVENLEAPAERENVDLYYRGLARVAPFSIPLRACYSADVPNLWVVGRCISATHVGLGPMRVQQSLGQLGQSVGTAAAIALGHGLSPREFAADPAMVSQLQQRILRDGVRLLTTGDRDPLDLARGAHAVGEAAPLEWPDEADAAGESAVWLPVRDGRAQVIPELGLPLPDDPSGAGDRRVQLLLRNPGAAPAHIRIVGELLDSIWDRPVTGDGAELGACTIAPGQVRWCDVLWTNPPAGRPLRLVVYPEDQAGTQVEWAAVEGTAPTGTLSEALIVAPGGPEARNASVAVFRPEEIDIPAYRMWRQRRRTTHVLQLDPPARPYRAANVNNGWAWPGRGANLWISPPQLPATLRLEWDEVQRIGQVQLAFDTDLDTGTDHRPGLHRAPESAESFEVDVRAGGVWRTVAAEDGNYQRRRVLRFPPVNADALRVRITATNGDPHGRIYEIRVYEGGRP